MLSIGTVVLGVDDMARAVTFWSAALGYVVVPPRSSDDWVVLAPPPASADRERSGGRGAMLALQRSSSSVEDHPRMHLDLWAGDAADRDAEVRRLQELGAERVAWDGYASDGDDEFVVLADPAGNRFCVLDSSGIPRDG